MPFVKQEQVIESPAFAKFLESVEGMDDDTIKDYRNKTRPFIDFCNQQCGRPADEIIKEIKAGTRDRYDVISDYKRYLSKQSKQSNNLRALVKKARAFLEYHAIEYSDRQFKIRIKLPRTVSNKKTPIKKETIRELVRTAPNIWLRTLLLFVAATGMRPIEALSIRHKDLDLASKPGRVTIRAEYTKMKVERYTFLTAELIQQVKDLLAYKHRERILACKTKDKKYYNIDLKPKIRPSDLLFSIYRREETARVPKVQSLYCIYNQKLNAMLDTMGLSDKEDDGQRRKITEYSLRRYVKSTVSNAGFADFSEWFIGHKHSTYWEVEDEGPEGKIDVFNRVEDRITYLDITGLEAKGADQESKIEHVTTENKSLQLQMGSLFMILAIPDEKERQKRLAEEAKKWTEAGLYRPKDQSL